VNHLVLAPLLLPLVAGVVVLLGGRGGLRFERAVGVTATLALLPVSALLLSAASEGLVVAYDVGDWPAPFGITLVLDRLSAWMVSVTAVVATAALLFALGRTDTTGRHFHALFQFQLLGINGAFLTGDLFNLFVFFEILLIASYALLSHGSRPERTSAAVHVAVINLLGSTLFLVAVGCLYAAAGTLNFADLAQRAAELPADRLGLWQAGGWMLLVVFALKAALLPLGFWLPGAYGTADGAVAALFAVLTKVGVVSIMRTSTLVFPGLDPGPVLWVAALATLAIGMTGMISARHLARLVAHSVVVSVGMLLVAIGLSTGPGLAAATYYLAHGTLATAALFLVASRIATVRGETGGLLEGGPAFRGTIALPTAYLLAAVAVAGLPPLGGFLAKLAILDAAVEAGRTAWSFAAVLAATLLSIVALARAGTTVFWKVGPDRGETVELPAWRPTAVAGMGLLLAGLVGLSLYAGAAFDFAQAAARQLLDPGGYVLAVLGAAEGGDR